MKRTRIAALALSLLFLGAALPVSAGQVQPVNTMTPYDTYVEPAIPPPIRMPCSPNLSAWE